MNNIGGIAKLEVFLSSDVLQQKLQTKLQLDRLILLYSTKAQLLLQWRDRLSGEYSYSKNQYREDELQVSATVEEYLDYQGMVQTLDRLQGRNLCIVITDLQGDVRAFNPLRLSYKYVGVNDLTKRNRYEISFTRAKRFMEYPYRSILSTVSVESKKELWPNSTDILKKVLIEPFSGGELTLYNLFISNNTTNYIPLKRNPKHLKSGSYTILAKHKLDPSIQSKLTFTI